MRILLISPAINDRERTNKEVMIPQLAVYILEGLTPPQHTVKIIEEEAEQIDFEYPCDLVGISCMTANAPRAYDLCWEFKKRGKKVVLGGVHPTILPDEALLHADCVVIGEAEGVWETLLDDYERNLLQPTYHNPSPDLARYIPKDYSKIVKKSVYKLIPVLTTKGCPYNCNFCCVSNIYGNTIRHLPIKNIVRDIQESGAKNIIFLDDNIIGDTHYAKALFKAITPLNINWVGQASISLLVNNNSMLRLASQSGCKALFMGIESISENQLQTMKKGMKEIHLLEQALKKIKKHKILIHASMVFGFDNDQKDIFNQTLHFLMKNKVSTVSFNILTPYPGTRIYEELKKEDRLITTDWKYYDHNTVVFKPKNMSPYELQLGNFKARKKFYSLHSVLLRMSGNLYNPLIYFPMNIGHMKQVRMERKRLKKVTSEIFESCIC
jgi:radical SAM superfamily enzyme YgiQ (UPF0313 family)